MSPCRFEIAHTLETRGKIELERRQEGLVVDPRDSVFKNCWAAGERGIQRGSVPPEFIPWLRLYVGEVVSNDATMKAIVRRQRTPELFELTTRRLVVPTKGELSSIEHRRIDTYAHVSARVCSWQRARPRA